jgi:hypothetical protein
MLLEKHVPSKAFQIRMFLDENPKSQKIHNLKGERKMPNTNALQDHMNCPYSKQKVEAFGICILKSFECRHLDVQFLNTKNL